MAGLVLTPFYGSEAVELGNRVWRRQILPVGDVHYKGRILKFTKDYLQKLAQSFRGGAYAQVPFQLADHENRHTNDPERTRGEITGMEVRDDGLWVTAELSERGDALLRENPKLGVSARIVEGYDRADGKFFPAAVQHVLGTLDPRISWMGGTWEAIEAASPAPDKVLDLTAESFTGLADLAADGKAAKKAAKAQRKAAKQLTGNLTGNLADTGTDTEGEAVVADLNALDDEQKARLAKLLAIPDEALDALAAGGTVLTPDELEALTATDDAGDGELSDAELDELIAAAEELDAAGLLGDEAEAETAEPGYRPNYMPEGEPVGAGLTAEAQFQIDLARSQSDELARELSIVTARLAEEDFQAEKRRLADMGVPPHITDLAKPLLEGAGHAVELSNGKTVDAGAIMRKVLGEYARQVRLLDLDVELGSPMDAPEDAGEDRNAQSRSDTVARMKSAMGLK